MAKSALSSNPQKNANKADSTINNPFPVLKNLILGQTVLLWSRGGKSGEGSHTLAKRGDTDHGRLLRTI